MSRYRRYKHRKNIVVKRPVKNEEFDFDESKYEENFKIISTKRTQVKHLEDKVYELREEISKIDVERRDQENIIKNDLPSEVSMSSNYDGTYEFKEKIVIHRFYQSTQGFWHSVLEPRRSGATYGRLPDGSWGTIHNKLNDKIGHATDGYFKDLVLDDEENFPERRWSQEFRDFLNKICVRCVKDVITEFFTSLEKLNATQKAKLAFEMPKTRHFIQSIKDFAENINLEVTFIDDEE